MGVKMGSLVKIIVGWFEPSEAQRIAMAWLVDLAALKPPDADPYSSSGDSILENEATRIAERSHSSGLWGGLGITLGRVEAVPGIFGVPFLVLRSVLACDLGFTAARSTRSTSGI